MNKKIISMIIIVVAVVIIGVVAFNKQSATTVSAPEAVAPASATTSSSATSTTGIPAGSVTFTLSDVATHNTEEDCYAAINGNVYNLTAWIKKHPGGDRAILSICGKDGSSAFNGQHGGDAKPERILAGFEVGALTK